MSKKTPQPATTANPKPELTADEQRAREIVKSVLPHYWKLHDAFYDCPEWEELQNAGAWGAALARMGEAFFDFLWNNEGEMLDAEDLWGADRMEEKKARAARRRARREAARAANG